MRTPLFRDRSDAGRALATLLAEYRDKPNVVVLGLPRGGVPVAHEVAQALHAPLDVFVVRKLGVPGHEELAMGAIASGGIRVVNRDVVDALGIPEWAIEQVAGLETAELQRREREFRGDRPPRSLQDAVVILVDDGLATGSTMRAAAKAVRSQHPSRLVVAVPVGARETCATLRADVDEVICGATPPSFDAVGAWYEDFSQTSDEEVRRLIGQKPA